MYTSGIVPRFLGGINMTKFIEERVNDLENEVKELKLIVHELRKPFTVIEEMSASSVEDTIEFEGQQYRKVDRLAREGDVVILSKKQVDSSTYLTANKPYEVFISNNEPSFENDDGVNYCVYFDDFNRTPETVDVYELITQDVQHQTIECAAAKTANQLRAEIIEKAKKFVEENGNKTHRGNHERTTIRFAGPIVTDVLEFVVNPEKRTVVALAKGKESKMIYARGIAKCMPSDVFNEHIGKAISLGRALGLDVSEFEQAVQPSEFAVGQMIHAKISSDYDQIETITKIVDGMARVDKGGCHLLERAKQANFTIINDTNAIYSEVNE